MLGDEVERIEIRQLRPRHGLVLAQPGEGGVEARRIGVRFRIDYGRDDLLRRGWHGRFRVKVRREAGGAVFGILVCWLPINIVRATGLAKVPRPC